MKSIMLFCFSVILFCYSAKAQPEKGTWEIGGSGYWIKSNVRGELRYKSFELDIGSKYFIFNNVSLGGEINYIGYKDYSRVGSPKPYGFYFAPVLEAYFFNKEKFGISLKGKINFLVKSSSNWRVFDSSNEIPSYMFGPKVSWNITSNLSTYLWTAFRKIQDFDNTKGFSGVIPSDNFDIRWGFSYFLHSQKK